MRVGNLTSQGLGSGKTNFGQSLNFSNSSQQPKTKKKNYFVISSKRKTGILSVKRDEVHEIRSFIIEWDESSNAVLNETQLLSPKCKQFQFVDSMLSGQVRGAVFFRALSKKFSCKYGSAPPTPFKNIVPYVYAWFQRYGEALRKKKQRLGLVALI